MIHSDIVGPPGEPDPRCDGRVVPCGDSSPRVICLRCLASARISTFIGLPVASAWRRPGWHRPRSGRRKS